MSLTQNQAEPVKLWSNSTQLSNAYWILVNTIQSQSKSLYPVKPNKTQKIPWKSDSELVKLDSKEKMKTV